MLSTVSAYAETSRESTPVEPVVEEVYDKETGTFIEQVSDSMFTGGLPAIHPVSPDLARKAFELDTLCYIRHPIDLIREIYNSILEEESSE